MPLLSGALRSFKYPVYAMVTLSPTLGIGPLPSLIIVLVTPMIAAVREKHRGLDVESVLILVRSVVRSLGKEENIDMEFSGKEGGMEQLYLCGSAEG